MVEVIPKHIKDVWDRWNIRGAIILSLSLQVILVCFSPLRKRTPQRLLTVLLWSSYLLADWTANFAVGLISKNQGKEPKPDDPPQDKKLMALWAPFLLLHLGGPDTITAFALEDNALWPRHMFGLVFQVIAGVYVVLLSLPNSLWVIIVLVFISGTIRYLERIMSMYNASLDNFRDSMTGVPDPGPNYAKLMEEYKARKEARLPTKFIVLDEPDEDHRPKKLVHPSKNISTVGRGKLHDLEIAHYAEKFFHTFKGLVVNLIFSFRQREESLEIFRHLKYPEEALRIIEIELGYLYDALFTKMNLSGTKILRSFALVAIGSAFILFHKIPNKSREFQEADVVITYTLFLVGIALELPLFYSVYVGWALAKIRWDDSHKNGITTRVDRLLDFLFSLRRLRWKEQTCLHVKYTKEDGDKCSSEVKHHILATPFLLRRWCGNIYAFNFLAFATKAEVERIHDTRGFFGRYSWMIMSFPFKILYFITRKLSGWLANVIICVHIWISHKVDETSRKHPLARHTIYPFYFGFLSQIPHFIKSSGDFISEFLDISYLLDQVHKKSCVHTEPLTMELWAFIFKELRDKSPYGDSPKNAKRIYLARGELALKNNLPEDVDREKMIRYFRNVDHDQSLLMWHIATELCYQKKETIPELEYYSNREFSKIISDYMMYLMILQPSTMSKVAGVGIIRFRDTLAEADYFFQRRHIENKRDVKIASDTILDLNTQIEPMGVKGDRSKSVLFDASRLAKDLMHMEQRTGKNKWEILSKVWVEMLCYAACHCEPTSHVEQLTRGAELINFVWFLMAHFGLVPSFQLNDRDSRAKLVIGK